MNFDIKKLLSVKLSDFDIDNVIIADGFGLEKIKNFSAMDKSTDEYDICFVSFSIVSNDKYVDMLKNLKAKYIIATQEIYDQFKDLDKTFLISCNPKISFFKAIEFFKPEPESFGRFESFDKSKKDEHVSIHRLSKVGKVDIASFTKIEKGCEIGDGTVIGRNCSIEQNVKIGKNCVIGNNISLSNCSIGDNCIIKSGAIIGGIGFGFEFDKKRMEYYTIPHLGRVTIGNNCNIGSCTVIDRGTINDTKIGNNVKLDSQVMVGHNVEIGDYTCIAGQSGIAGSAKIGKFCMIGGKAGISGHITIGDKVNIIGNSSVISNVESGETVMSSWFAKSQKDWLKFMARLNLIVKKNAS